MSLQQKIKSPPYSNEDEQSVIGAMMLENSRIADVAEMLRAEDFFREDHRIIFSGIVSLSEAGKPADAITVFSHLRALGQDDEAGGLAYIGTLANETPSAANVLTYAERIREHATLRQIISASGDAVESAYRPHGKVAMEILDAAESKIFAIRQRGSRANSGPVDAAYLAEVAERGIELRRNSDRSVSGLSTGIVDLDEKTTGLHPGDLVIVAGRPAMGKTSLALNIAEHCAIQQRKPALVFSMEMPGEQLMLRMLSSIGRIPMQALRAGSLDDRQQDKLTTAGGIVRSASLRIDETGALSPQELRARARREAMRRPLGVIVVDYIQLMQVPGTRENRTGEVAEISRNLKALAKELQVPIIALSQLNRGVESRDNKRPRMSDLRESGSIEQDADLILFVYRDEVYNEHSPDAGTAELIIGKQRNGPLGVVRTAFLGECTRFENLAPGWQPTARFDDTPKRERRGFGRVVSMSHAAHALGRDE